MEQSRSEVHIIVARCVAADGPDPIEILRRLGPQARVAWVEDADACLARAQAGTVDLIVVDDRLGAGCGELLEALREQGPPVVVLHAAGAQGAAVEAFRRGAADCVAAGDDLVDVLPVVALEQIHRRVEEVDTLPRSELRFTCEAISAGPPRSARALHLQHTAVEVQERAETQKVASIGDQDCPPGTKWPLRGFPHF